MVTPRNEMGKCVRDEGCDIRERDGVSLTSLRGREYRSERQFAEEASTHEEQDRHQPDLIGT